MRDEEIIMYDAPDTASIKTLTGWVAKDGHYWGENEHMARWSSCTHKTCECGNIHNKHWTCCDDCREKHRIERYKALPFQEWDGETPLCSDADDTYFFDIDSLIDHCVEHSTTPDDLHLVICQPNHMQYVEDDLWSDSLADDMYLDDCVPGEVLEALQNLNDAIKKHRPVLSWSPGKHRTSVKLPEVANTRPSEGGEDA